MLIEQQTSDRFVHAEIIVHDILRCCRFKSFTWKVLIYLPDDLFACSYPIYDY